MEKTKLTPDQLRVAKFLSRNYKKTGSGHYLQSNDNHVIKELLELDLIFFNRIEGYLPTTKCLKMLNMLM